MKPSAFLPSSPQQLVAIVVGLIALALMAAMVWTRWEEGRCVTARYSYRRGAIDCTGPPSVAKRPATGAWSR